MLPMLPFNRANLRMNIQMQSSKVTRFGKGEVTSASIKNLRPIEQARRELNLDNKFVNIERHGEMELARHFTIARPITLRPKIQLEKNVSAKLIFTNQVFLVIQCSMSPT